MERVSAKSNDEVARRCWFAQRACDAAVGYRNTSMRRTRTVSLRSTAHVLEAASSIRPLRGRPSLRLVPLEVEWSRRRCLLACFLDENLQVGGSPVAEMGERTSVRHG